jgi:hypothetical protein
MAIRLPGEPQSELDKEIEFVEETEFSFQLTEALKSGRYPFYVASNLIARVAGLAVSADRIQERLILAARDRSLPAYQLGQTLRWNGEMPIVSVFEIHWDDLNNWLAANEPRIAWRFREPTAQGESDPSPIGSATQTRKEDASEHAGKWWWDDYDIMRLAQDAGDSLRRQKKRASNRAIGNAIAKRIEECERRDKKRTPPTGEHFKNTVLKGWKYKSE